MGEAVEVVEDTVVCGRCGGEGEESYEEDGRPVTDPCYHCAGSGRISVELAFHDRLSAAAGVLADRWVSGLRRPPKGEEDGYDFGLAAAENGMSEGDYARALTWEKADEFMRELEGLSLRLQHVLVDELVPEREEPEAPAATTPTVPALPAALIPGADNDDEIPF